MLPQWFPPASVHVLPFPFSHLINLTIQLGILANAFQPSRARSLAFATFSSGAALGAVFGATIGGALAVYTPYGLSHYPLTSTKLFDPEKHGVPHSTY